MATLVLRIELDPSQGEPALTDPEEIIDETKAWLSGRNGAVLQITNPNLENMEEAILEELAAIGVWATDWGGITVDIE